MAVGPLARATTLIALLDAISLPRRLAPAAAPAAAPALLCAPVVENFTLGAGALNLDHLHGACVGVAWVDRRGAQYVAVRVGGALPARNCSAVAERRNIPPGWDFSGAGRCGQGAAGRGLWRDCLVHDACVWRNCDRDDAIPGGAFPLRVVGNDATLDPDCGPAYDAAVDDWWLANVASCEADSDCATGRCAWSAGGLHCARRAPRGARCVAHSDCEEGGRCAAAAGFTCQPRLAAAGAPAAATAPLAAAGSPLADRCLDDGDCADDAWCSYSAGFACAPRRADGAACLADAMCASGRCAWGAARGEAAPRSAVGAALRCRPRLARGRDCEEDTDCASGRCAWRDHRLVCLAKLPLRHAERGAGFRAGRLG